MNIQPVVAALNARISRLIVDRDTLQELQGTANVPVYRLAETVSSAAKGGMTPAARKKIDAAVAAFAERTR
jgi:hypothetical protein